jgi:hypothetical protein
MHEIILNQLRFVNNVNLLKLNGANFYRSPK